MFLPRIRDRWNVCLVHRSRKIGGFVCNCYYSWGLHDMSRSGLGISWGQLILEESSSCLTHETAVCVSGCIVLRVPFLSGMSRCQHGSLFYSEFKVWSLLKKDFFCIISVTDTTEYWLCALGQFLSLDKGKETAFKPQVLCEIRLSGEGKAKSSARWPQNAKVHNLLNNT